MQCNAIKSPKRSIKKPSESFNEKLKLMSSEKDWPFRAEVQFHINTQLSVQPDLESEIYYVYSNFQILPIVDHAHTGSKIHISLHRQYITKTCLVTNTPPAALTP